jgi:hypothetical protein
VFLESPACRFSSRQPVPVSLSSPLNQECNASFMPRPLWPPYWYSDSGIYGTGWPARAWISNLFNWPWFVKYQKKSGYTRGFVTCFFPVRKELNRCPGIYWDFVTTVSSFVLIVTRRTVVFRDWSREVRTGFTRLTLRSSKVVPVLCFKLRTTPWRRIGVVEV